MSGHTPTPWTVSGSIVMPPHGASPHPDNPGWFDRPVAECGSWPESRANAAFIARACNSHEALVRTLTTIVGMVDRHKDLTVADIIVAIDQARAALALAESE